MEPFQTLPKANRSLRGFDKVPDMSTSTLIGPGLAEFCQGHGATRLPRMGPPGVSLPGVAAEVPADAGAIVAGCEAARAFFAGVFKALLADNNKPIVAQANATNPRFTVGWLEYGQAQASVTDSPGRFAAR